MPIIIISPSLYAFCERVRFSNLYSTPYNHVLSHALSVLALPNCAKHSLPLAIIYA
jgi:hypothetical protein